MTKEEAIKELEKYKAMFAMPKHTMIWDKAIEIVEKIEPEIVYLKESDYESMQYGCRGWD